jgi:uncharacterized protein (DUF427 family)
MQGVSMPSAIAKIDDTVIADSDNTLKVEGNHYFPKDSVNFDLLKKTDMKTVCHWKGDANYFSITVDGAEYDNAAWTYRDPTTERAQPIKDYVAFYNNVVTVTDK